MDISDNEIISYLDAISNSIFYKLKGKGKYKKPIRDNSPERNKIPVDSYAELSPTQHYTLWCNIWFRKDLDKSTRHAIRDYILCNL